jgi:beta-ureidopropionase / N-carbamoyl-L-amino-acid hydrolase
VIPVIEETIERLLAGINAISLPGPGVTRPSYSDLESQAHALVAREAQRLGMTVTRDAALNLFARLPGRDRTAKPLFIGSHLDTVAMGGRYDGQAGVVGGMALAAAFAAAGTPPPMDLVVTITRAEESVWFPVSYIGSRSALGRLSTEDLHAVRSDTGRTLADHMREQGGDPDAVLNGPGLAPATFVEIHIEQGPILHRAGEPYALVSGIRGGLRYRNARIVGEWAHSGGAPREGRADTVFALADVVTALDRHWAVLLDEGADIAVTFGRVDAASPEHAFAKVPGRLDFCVDFRSNDVATLDRIDAIFRDEIAKVEAARGVRFELGAVSRSTPAMLSGALADEIAAGAARIGESPRRMASGGGHDASAFAQAGWESVMVFVRNWNGSHNPDEAMDVADLAAAVGALYATWRE